MGAMKLLMPYREKLLIHLPLYCLVSPMARPRFGSHRVYQPIQPQLVIMKELEQHTYKTLTQAVFVDHYIYLHKAGKGGAHPVQPGYGDLDNLVKTVNDALVKAKVLADDRFIVGSQSFKAVAKEDYCHVLIWSAAPHMEEFDVF